MSPDATRTYAPGPWSDGGTDASCEMPCPLSQDPDGPVHTANTHLIVAAPDLYVACLAWAAYVRHQGDCDRAEAGQTCGACYRLRGEARRQHEAAVAKAQGATTP